MLRVLAVAFVALLAAGPAGASGSAGHPSLDRAGYLRLAQRGVAQARAEWWNPRLRWYDDRLSIPGKPAYLWTAFPLFETVNAIAIASPTARNRAAVAAFAAGAERYWNPAVGGYAYLRGTNRRSVRTYFDDNGWWAIAFVDAFRATGNRRYLADSARAFRFILREGWDHRSGGTWWDTAHGHKTSEPLAAAAYAGAVLYSETRNPYYLRSVQRLIAWADARSWNRARGLYGRSDTDGTVMDYVEGMMIGAHLQLCKTLRRASHCRKAEALAAASARAFPAAASWSPTADAIYFRFLLDLHRHNRDPRWYELAAANARRALANARDARGLYLRGWDGKRVEGGFLRMHAGTSSLFAWLATIDPPRRPPSK